MLKTIDHVDLYAMIMSNLTNYKAQANHILQDNQKILYILSDYSRAKQYNIYSFLAFFPYKSDCFFINRDLLHEDFLPDGRRISYKSLNDRKRGAAIIPYLATYDKISGILLTVCISDSILVNYNGYNHLCSSWKPKVRSRVQIIVMLAIIISIFTLSLQEKIIWITDEDDIAANPTLLNALENYFQQGISEAHVDSKIEAEVVTSGYQDKSRRLEDVLSVCDLAAGTMAEFLSYMPVPYNNILLESHMLSWRCNLLLSWMAYNKNLIKCEPLIITDRKKIGEYIYFGSLGLPDNKLYTNLVNQFFG